METSIPVYCAYDKLVDTESLIPNPRNPNTHNDNQIRLLAKIIVMQGWRAPITVSNRSGFIVRGHGRLMAAKAAGLDCVPVDYQDYANEAAEYADLIADNRIAELAEIDKPTLKDLLEELDTGDIDMELTGFDEDALAELMSEFHVYDEESGTGTTEANQTLQERFVIPPFSVLDARQGYWQERKRAWIALGIQSEVGRGNSLTWTGEAAKAVHGERYSNRKKSNAPGGSLRPACDNRKQERGDSTGKPIKNNGLLGFSEQARTHYKKNTLGAIASNQATKVSPEYKNRSLAKSYSSQDRLNALQKIGDSRAKVFGTEGNASEQTGTSIFDPVLCEIAYRWFCPQNAYILDPFAGGSVRGVVAARLGHQYIGVDLRAEQIEANEAQADKICDTVRPAWITGDSLNIATLAKGEYDFVFSCPPYADLEVYSDNPADLSTMDYIGFIDVYRRIISKCVAMLKPNRFACFVVGDIRDKKGFYRNFVSDTITAFQDAGAVLYNEGILVTVCGSLPIRAGKVFQSSRKLGKTHQNVLVFYKGDPKQIKLFGDVECGDIPDVNALDD